MASPLPRHQQRKARHTEPDVKTADQAIKILFVDDDALILQMLTERLRLAGFSVLSASTAKEGIALFKTHRPSICILDIYLPDLDGFSLLKTLRQSPPLPEIILITGEGTMELVIEAMRHGASDFVPKPLKTATLLDAIERAKTRLNASAPGLTHGDEALSLPPIPSARQEPIQLYAFGESRLFLSGRLYTERDWENSITLGIFKRLMVSHREVVTLDQLIDAFKRNASEKSIRVMIYSAISQLRRLFEPDLKKGHQSRLIKHVEGGYCLDLGTFGKTYYYDVEHFDALVQHYQRNPTPALLKEAVALYKGDMFRLNRDDVWCNYPRDRRRDAVLNALSRLSDDAERAEDWESVKQFAHKYLDIDPLSEVANMMLINALLKQKRTLDAKRVVEQYKQAYLRYLGEPLPTAILNRVPSALR